MYNCWRRAAHSHNWEPFITSETMSTTPDPLVVVVHSRRRRRSTWDFVRWKHARLTTHRRGCSGHDSIFFLLEVWVLTYRNDAFLKLHWFFFFFYHNVHLCKHCRICKLYKVTYVTNKKKERKGIKNQLGLERRHMPFALSERCMKTRRGSISLQWQRRFCNSTVKNIYIYYKTPSLIYSAVLLVSSHLPARAD